MRIVLPLFCAFALLWSCQQHSHQHAEHEQEHNHAAATEQLDTIKGSPHRMVMGNIGDTHIHMEYNSPGVKGRIIWGGLVPNGAVWVTGAHNATSIDFSSDVRINGKTIPKGKYAFFTIPDNSSWTLILNRNWDQHLADEYDAKEDVLRLKVKPAVLDSLQERLLYRVVATNDKQGEIEMRWEKRSVSLPIELE